MDLHKKYKRVLAVGDVHGCANTLKKLIETINPTIEDKLIFLGDYIDRGDKSFEVVDYLIELNKSFDCVFLKGNHEDLLLNCLKGQNYSDCRTFMMNGGNATIKSYRKNIGYKNDQTEMPFDDFPMEHQEFYNNLKLYHEEEGFLFVHAGVNPYTTFDQQNESDFLWIRGEFLQYNGRIMEDVKVIHGHTPMEPDKIDEYYNDKYNDRMNLDTACVFGYVLTCIDVLTNDKYTQKMIDEKIG